MTDYVLIESGDADDAENVGALLGHPALVDYVLYGLEITNLNATNGEFDVTEGKAYISVGDLATSDGETRHEIGVAAHLDARAGESIATVDGRNYVYVDPQIGVGDSPTVNVYDSDGTPGDDELLIAILDAEDTDDDGVAESLTLVEQPNRGPVEEPETIAPPRGTVGVAGAIATGPQEAPLNALRGEYMTAPMDDEATQGDTSLLTLLKSGLDPAIYVERTLDGQGGAYGHQLEAALGRFARINSNLSWEYDTLSDVPNWSTNDGGASTWTYNVNSRPRRMTVEHDGSGSDDYGGAVSAALATYQSIGGFRITFHDVSYTDNADNELRIGLSDAGAADNLNDQNSIYFCQRGGSSQLKISGNGYSWVNVDFTSNHNLSLEYDGSEVRGYTDGNEKVSQSHSGNFDYKPVIQLFENGNKSASETIEVQQITVEPLPEVLQ